MLSRNVARHPAATALVWVDGRMTFAELQRAVDGFAARLAKDGLIPGKAVALLLPNSPEFVVGVLAVARLGAIALPLNPLFQDPELRYYFRDCEPSAVLATTGLAERRARLSAGLATNDLMLLGHPDGRARHIDESALILEQFLTRALSVGAGGCYGEVLETVPPELGHT